MVRIIIFLFSVINICISCKNNAGKDVKKADSANQARLDSGLNNNSIVIDENSSAFLVRASALFDEIVVLTGYVRQQSETEHVKNFVNQLYVEYSSLKDSLVRLAIAKNIVLPSDSLPAQESIARLKNEGIAFLDKSVLNYVNKTTQSAVELFENALLDAKDPEIRSFADKSLLVLRKLLTAGKHLEK